MQISFGNEPMIEDFCLRAVAFDLGRDFKWPRTTPCQSEPIRVSVIAQGWSENTAHGLNR